MGSGRETNYVYSYKKTPGTIYRSHPIPEGVGFGGSMGRERLWLDADFAFLTVHHHAVDKTYHSGALVPGQVWDISCWYLSHSFELRVSKHNTHIKLKASVCQVLLSINLVFFILLCMSHLSCHLFVAKYALYTWTNVVDRLIFYVQGYAAVQGKVGEVEVWGLGGSDADEQQAKFQHRENLFAEQRRKASIFFLDIFFSWKYLCIDWWQWSLSSLWKLVLVSCIFTNFLLQRPSIQKTELFASFIIVKNCIYFIGHLCKRQDYLVEKQTCFCAKPFSLFHYQTVARKINCLDIVI